MGASLRRLATALLVLAVVPLAMLLGASQAHAATAAARIPHSYAYEAWHYALDHHGAPYAWGGTGPYGFDCSGLVYAAYRSAGVHLPRDTFEMLDSSSPGVELVPTSHPTTGSLAFYGEGHVELYVRPNETYGAQAPGTSVGYHFMSSAWHATMYFNVLVKGRDRP